MGRPGRCRQISLACAGSTRSVLATPGLPPLTARAFPSTLLRLQGAGPELRALPRPKPLRFRFSGTPQRCRLSWACVLCLPRRSAQAARNLTRALSPGVVCLIPSAVPASVSRRAGQVRLMFLMGS